MPNFKILSLVGTQSFIEKDSLYITISMDTSNKDFTTSAGSLLHKFMNIYAFIFFIKKYFHLTSGVYVYGQELSIVKMATLQKLI